MKFQIWDEKNHRHCKRTDDAGEVSLAYIQGESIRVEGGCQEKIEGGYIANFKFGAKFFGLTLYTLYALIVL